MSEQLELSSKSETNLKGPESDTPRSQKAEKFLASTEGVLLTAEETAILEEIAKRIDLKEEQEANEESQKSPENIVIGRLSKVAERLESEGLTEDAQIILDKIASLNELIDNAATAISSDPAEESWFSDRGKKDHDRLDWLLNKMGIKRTDFGRGVRTNNIEIYHSDGDGIVRDKLGTWYRADQIDSSKDLIESSGGVAPKLSDEGLQIVLDELGILKEGEKPLRLADEEMRYGKYVGHRTGSHENGQQLYYNYSKKIGGNTTNTLSMSLDPDFIISAALRKIEANNNNQA